MPRPAMPQTASMTSQRCSMQKRMMRSNMMCPDSVTMLGAGFAQLRLQDERVGGGVVVAGLHAAENFDRAAIGTTDLQRRGDEAAGTALKTIVSLSMV